MNSINLIFLIYDLIFIIFLDCGLGYFNQNLSSFRQL